MCLQLWNIPQLRRKCKGKTQNFSKYFSGNARPIFPCRLPEGEKNGKFFQKNLIFQRIGGIFSRYETEWNNCGLAAIDSAQSPTVQRGRVVIFMMVSSRTSVPELRYAAAVDETLPESAGRSAVFISKSLIQEKMFR